MIFSDYAPIKATSESAEKFYFLQIKRKGGGLNEQFHLHAGFEQGPERGQTGKGDGGNIEEPKGDEELSKSVGFDSHSTKTFYHTLWQNTINS